MKDRDIKTVVCIKVEWVSCLWLGCLWESGLWVCCSACFDFHQPLLSKRWSAHHTSADQSYVLTPVGATNITNVFVCKHVRTYVSCVWKKMTTSPSLLPRVRPWCFTKTYLTKYVNQPPISETHRHHRHSNSCRFAMYLQTHIASKLFVLWT